MFKIIHIFIFSLFFISCTDSNLDVISTQPEDRAINISTNTKIIISLNTHKNEMNLSTINSSTFTIRDENYNKIQGVRYIEGYDLTFVPFVPLDYDTRYTVTLSREVRDIYNTSVFYDYLYTFTTRSKYYFLSPRKPNINKKITPLEVSYTNPTINQSGVKLDVNIVIYFTTELDVNSISNNNFSLIDEYGSIIKGYIEVRGNRAIFNPDVNFKSNTTYDVSLTTSIKSKDGQYLKHMYQFYFYTQDLE